MNSITRTAIVAAAMLVPALASAQSSFSFSFGFGTGGACIGGYIECLGATIIGVINGTLVPVLFAVAFIVFLYGIAKAYILSVGDEEGVKTGHKLILWGLIGFVVMISVWGLVNVVANTFGLYGVSAPIQPVSYPY